MTPSGTQILSDARVLLAQFNISGDLNQVDLDYSADTKEDTAFGATFHTMKPGMRNAKIHQEGFSQFGTGFIDDIAQTRIGTADVPILVSPNHGNAGDVCWFMKALHYGLKRGGKVGDMFKFALDAIASGTNTQLVQGMLLEDGYTSRVAGGNTAGAQINVTGVSALQKLYASLHVLVFVGTNVTIKIQSSATQGGSYTDRITFTLVTGKTSESPTPVAGAITDTWWRVLWSGTFTSFSAVVGAGIQ